MTTDPPTPLTSVANCPTCGQRVEVEATVEPNGTVQLADFPAEVLIAHQHCDLLTLAQELSSRAYHLSKVTVYRVKGDDS